jgi:hypothetical protein
MDHDGVGRKLDEGTIEIFPLLLGLATDVPGRDLFHASVRRSLLPENGSRLRVLCAVLAEKPVL